MLDVCSSFVSVIQRGAACQVRLTIYTDFSLRLLMFLALKGNGLATIAEVAKAYGISKNHLMKVTHQLGLAGYVETVRGKGGGMRLAQRPQDIVLGEVVRRTEPDMTLVPCFAPDGVSCPIFQSCALRGALSKARDAFFRCSTGTPWKISSVRAQNSANCCPSILTGRRQHKSHGMPGQPSHRRGAWLGLIDAYANLRASAGGAG
jgi:Rrf2 family nitric oxide-sensitive transcriptional repressor